MSQTPEKNHFWPRNHDEKSCFRRMNTFFTPATTQNRVHKHTHMHVRKRTHTHARTHARTHTHTHTHTHAHTCKTFKNCTANGMVNLNFNLPFFCCITIAISSREKATRSSIFSFPWIRRLCLLVRASPREKCHTSCQDRQLKQT